MRSFLGQLDQWRMDWNVAFPTDPDDMSDGLRSHMRGSSSRLRRLEAHNADILCLGPVDYYHS